MHHDVVTHLGSVYPEGKGGMFEATGRSGALTLCYTLKYLLEHAWGVSVNSGPRFAKAR